jgi:uncharacterized protein YneF (UPF0154 family)
MNLALLALALLQVEPDNSNMWIIIIAVLVLLFFIVVVVAIGLVVFFVMRKRKKAQLPGEPAAVAAATAAVSEAASYSPSLPEQPAPEPVPAYETPASEYVTAEEETSWPATTDMAAPVASPPPVEPEAAEFDPSRTVAIVRDPPTVEISYGKIKFVSGVLSGEEFEIEPAGAYIGREPSLAQIVVSDPRISKRHLWVGIRDGAVTIVDQESRNGTFVNDPRSERVHEAKLNSGDVVIMGESDVARFEFHA